jgi:hypothetical protein
MMKKLLLIAVLPLLLFAHCKTSIPEPTQASQTSRLTDYWHNYNHYTYNSVLDTLFSDTNQFVMFDMDITDTENITKYYRDGSDPRAHTYDTATARMNIYAGTFKVTYKMEFSGNDSMTLSSLPTPAGGIPFPGSDEEIWVFVRK